MAKGVGLDAGEYEVKVVELDGSYRKPRLTKVSIDKVQSEVDESEEYHARMEAESALHALKDAKVARDNVTLGFPCREAVLRDLKVPFVGADSIRKVIKFEAESSIHSHNVDDMVVDFRVLKELDGETQVMVAAVPKRSLGTLLDALESMGIEPEKVDLDTMALYRVAEWAGCFDEAAPEVVAEGEASLPVTTALADGQRTARVVVDVGARSTRILAVVQGDLIDMRALRVGADTISEEVAAQLGISLSAAREAIVNVLETEEDFVLAASDDDEDDPEIQDAEAEGEELAEAVVQSEVVSVDLVLGARDRFMVRLRRELVRFLTGLARVGGIEKLYVTGGGSFLPGMNDVLREAFGCEPEPLDVLAGLNHNLEDEDVRWIGPRIAVAIGLALGPMGGPAGFNFRQEDLAFRRRFDRIKFPLAIACMLAVFLPFIYGMRLYRNYDRLSQTYGKLHDAGRSEEGRGRRTLNPTFWGYVGHLANKTEPRNVGKFLGRREFETLKEDLIRTDTFRRLLLIRDRLDKYLKTQQAETGVYEALELPSGYYTLTYFSEIIQDLEAQLGSFLITEIDLSMPLRADNRHLSFSIAIRGENYRGRFEELKRAFEKEFEKPDSPFASFAKSKDEQVFRGEVEGTLNELKLMIKKDWLR